MSEISTIGFIDQLRERLSLRTDASPWAIVANLPRVIQDRMVDLTEGFHVSGGIAIHETARIEPSAILKAPLIIDENAYVGAYACLRGGVYVGKGATVGHGAEIKSSVLMDKSAAAHFNFIGDSLIGSGVNFEAGSIVANHYNERQDKMIKVVADGRTVETGVVKFGAMVGDGSRIGANAVLSPGTILQKNSIVGRLELVDQNKKA